MFDWVQKGSGNKFGVDICDVTAIDLNTFRLLFDIALSVENMVGEGSC